MYTVQSLDGLEWTLMPKMWCLVNDHNYLTAELGMVLLSSWRADVYLLPKQVTGTMLVSWCQWVFFFITLHEAISTVMVISYLTNSGHLLSIPSPLSYLTVVLLFSNDAIPYLRLKELSTCAISPSTASMCGFRSPFSPSGWWGRWLETEERRFVCLDL